MGRPGGVTSPLPTTPIRREAPCPCRRPSTRVRHMGTACGGTDSRPGEKISPAARHARTMAGLRRHHWAMAHRRLGHRRAFAPKKYQPYGHGASRRRDFAVTNNAHSPGGPVPMSSPIDTRPPHGHGMQRNRFTPRREDLSRRTPCPYDGGIGAPPLGDGPQTIGPPPGICPKEIATLRAWGVPAA
jgi:hypothetical protein